MDYHDLTGRVALVTGGRRGIGRAIARRLAVLGASIIIGVVSRNEDQVAETLSLFQQAGHPIGLIELDLTDERARSDAIARASECFGPIDIVVNNAAGNVRRSAAEMNLADRRMLFEVNFQSAIDLIQQALPHMRARRWGRILNILSGSIEQPPIPYPGPERFMHESVLYGASKAALERYTLGLAAELHGTGVLANGLFPYKVCLTEGNSDGGVAAARRHPEWAEGVEVMAEAAMLLVANTVTGVSANSRHLLHIFQQPLHGLDGKTVIGDVNTLPSLG
jgi:3-oxoacyl-[acyl-carrier protein] reductase